MYVLVEIFMIIRKIDLQKFNTAVELFLEGILKQYKSEDKSSNDVYVIEKSLNKDENDAKNKIKDNLMKLRKVLTEEKKLKNKKTKT